MQEIKEWNATATTDNTCMKYLLGILKNKKIPDKEKLDKTRAKLNELATVSIEVFEDMKNYLNPHISRLHNWWQREMTDANLMAAMAIDFVDFTDGYDEINATVKIQFHPHFAYLKLKKIISILQQGAPQLTPAKLREIIQKKEEKRRQRGFLFAIDIAGDTSLLDVLNRGIIPSKIQTFLEHCSIQESEVAKVHKQSCDHWILKNLEGKSIVTIGKWEGVLLAVLRNKESDWEKVTKLTREIQERAARYERSQKRWDKIERAFETIAKYPSLGISEAQVRELCLELHDLLGEFGEIPCDEIADAQWQIHLSLKRHGLFPDVRPGMSQKKMTWLSLILIMVVAILAMIYLRRPNQISKSVEAKLSDQHRAKPGVDTIDRALEYARLGDSYLDQGKYREAIENYDRALKFKPDLPDVHLHRGIAYSRQNLYEQAIEEYGKALQLDSQLARACFDRGNIYFHQGRHRDALEDFNRALELNPNLADLYVNRGTVYSLQNLYEKAVKDYNQALQLNPNLAEAYANLGRVYSKQDQPQQAIENYNRALDINPKLVRVYIDRGIAYVKQNQYEQAIEDYSRALNLDPRLAQACFNRGNVYFLQGRHREALEDFNHALTLDSNLANIYLSRGTLYSMQNRHGEALEDYAKALELDPNVPEVYVNRGTDYCKQKLYQPAIEDFTRAIKINPNLVQAHIQRGEAYFHLQQYQKARDDFSSALKLDNNLAKAYVHLGWICYYEKQYANSIDFYNRALQLKPELAAQLHNYIEESQKKLANKQ